MEIKPFFYTLIQGTPHDLLELSVRSYYRYKSNSIELTDLSLVNSNIRYNNVKYGSNLNTIQQGNIYG